MYKRSMERLFADGDLMATLDAHLAKIEDKVNEIPKTQFLISSDDQIVDHIRSEIFIEAIKLHDESKVMEQEETQIDVSSSREYNPFDERGSIIVPGVRVTISIPFTGDPILWKLRPSRWTNVFPRGSVRPPGHDGIGYLDIVIEQHTDAPAANIKQELDRTINLIKSYLADQQRDVEQRNTQLDGRIRQASRARRERLEKQEGIAKLLGIPLKKKEGAPEIKPIKVESKLIWQLPPPPKNGYIPEPGITEDDYEDILAIVRHEGRTFETTPSTYSIHGEEDLRNIILAHLNGHYKGSATGETFRGKGKTDIRIEAEDRAAFVAECKVWRGPKELNAALDQLLGYLTWRDGKCAIVIFNKNNAKFSQLLQDAPKVLQEHSRLHKELGPQRDGEWRFIFTSKEDEGRQVTVHVFLFNLYVRE